MKAEYVERKDLVVGATVGYLTITQRHPFRQRCVCGKDCSYSKSHILMNGVRSCGCRSKPGKVIDVQPGQQYGIFTIIERAEGKRHWLVECRRCNQRKTTTEQNFLYNKPKRCAQCD